MITIARSPASSLAARHASRRARLACLLAKYGHARPRPRHARGFWRTLLLPVRAASSQRTLVGQRASGRDQRAHAACTSRRAERRRVRKGSAFPAPASVQICCAHSCSSCSTCGSTSGRLGVRAMECRAGMRPQPLPAGSSAKFPPVQATGAGCSKLPAKMTTLDPVVSSKPWEARAGCCSLGRVMEPSFSSKWPRPMAGHPQSSPGMATRCAL